MGDICIVSDREGIRRERIYLEKITEQQKTQRRFSTIIKDLIPRMQIFKKDAKGHSQDLVCR